MLIIATTIAVSILLAVGIHYEVLSLASNCMRSTPLGHRVRVAAAVLAALGAHFIEVIAFALGWKLLLVLGEARLSIDDPSFVQLLYFSSATYTSLGYGDIVPLGDAGLFAGSEAVTGLVLIAWTASFTYFEMRAYWDDGEQR